MISYLHLFRCWNLHSIYRSRNISLNVKLFHACITMIILWCRVVNQRFLGTVVGIISSCNFMTRRDQLVIAIGAFHQIFESCPVLAHNKHFAEGMGLFLVTEFWREGTCDSLRPCVSLLVWEPPEFCLLICTAATLWLVQWLGFVELGSLKTAMSKWPSIT